MESLRRRRAHVSSCCCVMPSGGALLNTSTNSTPPTSKLLLHQSTIRPGLGATYRPLASIESNSVLEKWLRAITHMQRPCASNWSSQVVGGHQGSFKEKQSRQLHHLLLHQAKCACNPLLGCVIIGPGVGRLERCAVRLPQNEYSSEQLQQWVGKLSPTRQCGQKPLLRMNAGSCKPALCGLSVGSDETALSPSCSQRLALPPHSATARPAPRNDSVFLTRHWCP